MATVNKKQLESVLTHRLKLKTPQFVLEKVGQKWSGNVISPSFNGIRDEERQRLLWDALEAEFGSGSVHIVGTLLAYAPEEWEVNLVHSPVGKH
jgi:acid stress-induced BolA-like protein IbaG/YrbA